MFQAQFSLALSPIVNLPFDFEIAETKGTAIKQYRAIPKAVWAVSVLRFQELLGAIGECSSVREVRPDQTVNVTSGGPFRHWPAGRTELST
jgi:hypothetical protein